MNEYICKEDFIKILKEKSPIPFVETNVLIGAVSVFPAADVQPVKHGKWIYNVAFYKECSECKCVIEDPKFYEIFLDGGQLNYCPNCGADMRGE